MLKLSLIIPVLNHEDKLEEVIHDIRATIPELSPEILIVYDVTQADLLDAVGAEQADLEKRYGVRSLTRTGRRGFGSALREGVEAASGEVVVPIMGDCSDDLAAIPRMMAAIESGADVAVGSRYMAGGRIVGDTPKQRLSWLYSLLIRQITGIPSHDMSNSFKASRREVWEQARSEAESFDISVEITVKAAAHGFKIAEVPSVWTNRRAGLSSFRIARELQNYGRWLVYAATYLRQPGVAAWALGSVVSAAGFVLMRGRLPAR